MHCPPTLTSLIVDRFLTDFYQLSTVSIFTVSFDYKYRTCNTLTVFDILFTNKKQPFQAPITKYCKSCANSSNSILLYNINKRNYLPLNTYKAFRDLKSCITIPKT